MQNEWVEVSLSVIDSLEDEAAALFVWAGATGVEVRDASTLSAETGGRVRVVAYVEQGSEDAFVSRLEPVLATVLDMPEEQVRGLFKFTPVTRQEWNEFWKRTFDIQRIGRFVVRPTWKEVAPAAGETVFVIDPGMAFGTGLHATTRMVLRELERMHASGFSCKNVLDMGTGTGILSMACAVLYPDAVIDAVDNDPDAVETAVDVIRGNGLSSRIRVMLEWPERPVDLILANIQRDVLLELNPLFLRNLEAGGRMVFSGILADQAAEIIEKTGLEPVHQDAEDEWRLLVFEKPAKRGAS